MTRRSAGILPYRWHDGQLQVFLVHFGGPLWARRDVGAWSIAKGEYADDEAPTDAAAREFLEETGFTVAKDGWIELTPVTQRSGKIVAAWAVPMDCDPRAIRSNTFSMEWPKGSGKVAEFPEVDRAEWFAVAEAARRIVVAQRPFLAELEGRLGASGP